MPVFKRDREEQQQNSRDHVVSEMKTRVYKQAGLAVTAILVTVVLLFAMSTAWYSNVLEAGSITFQAEKWELNAGDLSTDGSSVIAQPGARGILPVSYKNTSESPLNIYVGVSKENMDRDLKKRVYFYTETPYTVERKGNSEGESKEETVSRRYLTNGTAAPYTVLSRGQLTMSDDFCSVDTPIYWEWVYDLLGYYVRVSSTPASDGSAVELEYLRPIVYDYDKATFDADGNLATVDGKRADLFLQELAETDGYLNNFSESNTVTDPVNQTKYYIVDNEAESLGYYTAIRLLTKQEIAAANAWDTEQGKNGASFNDLKITITGETANVDIINVGTTVELTNALQSENGGYIRLSGNLELTENITVSAKKPVILDLNGATLTGSATGGDLFTVGKGRELTVINGTIKNSAGNKTLFGVNNGKLTVSNVTATAEGESQWGIYIQDNNGATAQDGDSIVYITHSTISTGLPTVMVIGNNTTTAQKTRCVIENSTLTSDYVAVCGNGQTVSGGTAIEIKDSIITGKYAAVYHPQDNSTLHAENATFTGNTGIAVKGGSVYLDNCVVTGSAAAALAGSFNNNGFTDTGAAVYLEAGYERDNIAVYITGENSRITAKKQQALLLYHDEKDTNTHKARIAVSGGTYSSDVKDYLANALFQSKLNDDGFYIVITTKDAQSGS